MDKFERQRLYTVLALLLLLLAGALGWFFWNKSQTYLNEKVRTKVMLDSLITVKGQLEADLDSLSFNYDALSAENKNLQGMLASATTNLKAREAAIIAMKGQNAQELSQLSSQIEALQQAKTEFQTVIGLLQQENTALKSENSVLKGKNQELSSENMQLSTEVSELAKKLEDQIRRTQSAVFKASAFRVEVEKRNDKLTTRAKRVRELNISFDLADVPEPFRGQKKLYLAISDENGKPIADAKSTPVTIDAPALKVNITAQSSKLVVLEETQRINFNYILDERLSTGNYVVAIYCDKGLLGATSVRLR
jgi:regulator of replication initiation timing/cell division protein FtsB